MKNFKGIILQILCVFSFIGFLASCSGGGGGSPADLSAYASSTWTTYGGDLANTRFSSLTQIDKTNVKNLQVAWTFNTQPSAAASNLGYMQGNPIVYDNKMFITDPGLTNELTQNVFALNAKTGDLIWRKAIPLSARGTMLGYFLHLAANRGVAIGNGRVYVSTVDASTWALDINTGDPITSFGTNGKVSVGDVSQGHFISAAPIYVPASKVPSGGIASGKDIILTGIAGSEHEMRGFFKAFDATTGQQLWTFNTVPGPTDFGGNTWPTLTGNFANPYLRGGAAVWMNPSYDADTGIIYMGTGNPNPDLDGTHREGDNLFASSVLALNIKDGTRAWHYQMVHHDLWDYDAAGPPVLFDIVKNGITIKAVGMAGKTGWFYILDRLTGIPVFPCPESPVPNSDFINADGKREIVSPTQPKCSSDNFVPQGGRNIWVNNERKYIFPIFTPPGSGKSGTEGPNYITTAISAFLDFLNIPSPFGTTFSQLPSDTKLIEPSAQGGADWAATSYSPLLNLAFIGASVMPMKFTAAASSAPIGNASIFKVQLGGYWTFPAELVPQESGSLSAMDVRTGKIEWQVNTSYPNYTGSCVTASNILFIGETENDPNNAGSTISYFSAFDATNGTRLKRLRIPSATSAPCTTYSIDGKQYVAVATGASVIAKGSGSSYTVFTLSGN